MRLLRVFITLFFALILFRGAAQTGKDSMIAQGSKFKTNGGRVFWMGKNYRSEWNTPIKVPVIDLSKEHGGLTPVKRGGGKQTKSLRLEDKNGRQYTLRSIEKFITSKTLPGDLQSEAAADLVSDGVSASYPYAALSIPVLAEAAGIPHGSAKVVYIPDDPRLGEYRTDFANMMALYEERLPDTVQKGYDTDEVAEKLEKDNDNDVDQLALLRIRILDMFVMDLDRHEDQWTWGAYDRGKGQVFYPIAKDRDQAFYTNQGVLPWFASRRAMVPQLEGFKPEADHIGRFNFAARNLDRFFLNELTEADWKQEVDRFVARMTDEVIDRALAQQPREIKAMSANKIAATLKKRREYLVKDVMKYYDFISEVVTVTSSDKKELFDITRNDDGSVNVQVYKVDKDGQQSIKMYERKFIPGETKEIRLFGFDGDDRFTVKGSNDKIKVRVIGGGGEDVFDNTGKSGATFIYDKKSGNNTVKGRFKNRLADDTTVNSYERLGYKYQLVAPGLSVGYNPDDGVYLGVGLKIIRHGFRKSPYKSMHQIVLNHALSTNAFNFRYNNEFIGVLGDKLDLVTDIDIKAPNNVTNFFGYGINSVYDKTKPGKFRYYRARYDLADAAIMLRQRFSDKVMLSVGPSFQYYEMDHDDKLNMVRYISQAPANGLDPATLYKTQTYIGAQVILSIDTRDHKVLPQKGVNWQTTFRHLSGLKKTPYDLTQLNTDFTFYADLIENKLTFANRLGGGINFGEDGFEFYQAQYLGSEDNLRGFRKFRFAGKSKAYNQAELRWKIANFKTYLFPAAFGIMAFVDAGRVWLENDVDSGIKAGYGGGIWFSPLSRILLTVTYAVSKEDKMPLIRLGWRF